MNPTLVVMAAGLGSRFGGTKQLATVGPRGQALFDYSIVDARRAGFGEVVVIVRSAIEDDVRSHLRSQHPDLSPRLVRQDDLGPDRAKPWGTLHAVLSAAAAVEQPFAVINADDYYGPASFALAADHLAAAEPGVAANVAFPLGQTVPPRGAVTRAVCRLDGDRLRSIVETEGCERRPDGTLVAGGNPVPEDTVASMNFWCFHPEVFDAFQQRWRTFLDQHGQDPTAECQLPTVVGELVTGGRLTVRVVASPETWIGITNPDDLGEARRSLARRTG